MEGERGGERFMRSIRLRDGYVRIYYNIIGDMSRVVLVAV